ncbi:MAG: hypothetical protein Q9212_006616, partial [Teloschistes hypoglaucus]
MAPAVAAAKLTLSYPLYASDFDPQNSSFLLVGGGGGQGRTGIGNKIVIFLPSPLRPHRLTLSQTLINTSRKQTLSEVVDIDLSKDEDSVTSLAVASSTPSSVTAFAGINSSEKDQAAGKNEHLRSFRLEYPPKRRPENDAEKGGLVEEYKGQTAPLGRASLFTPSTAIRKETYQRITRLSRPCKVNGGQLGAIATGLAPEGEIVLFDAKTNGPMGPWVEARLSMGKGQEAADVDIIGHDDAQDVPPGTFSVAYSTDYEVHAFKMTLKQNKAPVPQSAFEEPHPDAFASTKDRSKFRSLRFLSPSLLLLLQNRPKRSGSDLLLLELSSSYQARIIGTKRLHKGINSATALSVTDLASSKPSQSTQHIIAVAGQDTSISILTLEHRYEPPFKSPKFRLHTLLRAVHPLQITSLSFSTFSPPQTSQKDTPPQYIKFASTSVANTVVLHTLPLTPYPPPSQKSSKQRYVLTSPGRSDAAQMTFSIIVSALVIALGAFLLQAFTEIRGGSPEYLGAKGWLSQRVHDYIAVPYILENGTSIAPNTRSSMSDRASSTSSSLLGEITTTLSSVSGRASSTSTSIHEEITDKFADLQSTASSSTAAAKESLADTPENAKKALSAALDAASSAAAELKEASEAYSATASDTLTAASNSLTSAASAATQKPSNQYAHIRDLLSRHHHHRRHATPPIPSPSSSSNDQTTNNIPHMIIHSDDDDESKLQAGYHHVGREGARAAKRWEELSAREREIWKGRLLKAGVWVKEEGEAVLKGV